VLGPGRALAAYLDRHFDAEIGPALADMAVDAWVASDKRRNDEGE
jgi:hypothetical protein